MDDIWGKGLERGEVMGWMEVTVRTYRRVILGGDEIEGSYIGKISGEISGSFFS